MLADKLQFIIGFYKIRKFASGIIGPQSCIGHIDRAFGQLLIKSLMKRIQRFLRTSKITKRLGKKIPPSIMNNERPFVSGDNLRILFRNLPDPSGKINNGRVLVTVNQSLQDR